MNSSLLLSTDGAVVTAYISKDDVTVKVTYNNATREDILRATRIEELIKKEFVEHNQQKEKKSIDI